MEFDHVIYVRWRLPVKYCKNEDGSPAWLDGQTPDVTPGERAKYLRMAEAAWWEVDPGSDVLDPPLFRMRNKFFRKKEYIGRHRVATDHGFSCTLYEVCTLTK